MTTPEQENKYNGWLTSPNFLKRSFAVFGHLFVAQILISLVIGVVVLTIAGTIAALVAIFN